jgi:integrase
MADAGQARTVINGRVNRIRRMLRWAVSEELIPVEVYHAAKAVPGLARGRTTARETEPVRPVPWEVVDDTLPFLPPVARAMVEFQRLTGCRPQDACRLRGRDLDASGPVWVYRPPDHKTAYAGKVRTVFVGPKAQEVLRPFLVADPAAYPAAYLFRPASRSRDRFTSEMYAKVVGRAVRRANKARARRRAEVGPNLPDVPHWFPNQLRHSYATEVRKRFGLEAAQVALGHSKADVTQVYAERNKSLAARVAAEMG